LLLLLVSTTAFADDEGTEDPTYTPFPRVSVAAALQAHGSEVQGHYESGLGPALELAVGSGRWQLTGEGSIASSTRMKDTGSVSRAAVGLRWLARQFAPDHDGGVELYLASAVGAERFDVGDVTTRRSELALGGGLQLRLFHHPRFIVRFDARAVFTDANRTGYLVGMGGGW